MPDIFPLQLLLATFSGWVNRHQALPIDYLVEENRALKDQLGGKRLRLSGDQRGRLALYDCVALHSMLRPGLTCVRSRPTVYSGQTGFEGVAGVMVGDDSAGCFAVFIARPDSQGQLKSRRSKLDPRRSSTNSDRPAGDPEVARVFEAIGFTPAGVGRLLA